MDLISKTNIVHRLEKRKLLISINCVAALAIFFFGYDQGMMGSVNVSTDYGIDTMGYGIVDPEALKSGVKQVKVTNSLLQGGIVTSTQPTWTRPGLMSLRYPSTISALSSAAW